MNFWLRNGIFAIFLSILAYLLLANSELLLSLSDDLSSELTSSETETEVQAETAPTIDKQVIEPPQRTKKPVATSSNKAADGLSRFYATLRGADDDDKGPKIRNNVVYLPEPRGNLEKILTAKAMVTRPLKKNWRGSQESRPFRVGSTLLQKLVEYAEQDGLEIMWRLNRDLIIKDPFRINKDILQTAYQVGMAIHGHFPEGVTVYFCYKQRTIVFNSGDNEFLAKECRLLTSSSSYSSDRRY